MATILKRLRAAQTAGAAAEIIDQCASTGALADILPQLDHDYVIDGASRGYMSALITISARAGITLDLRCGVVVRVQPGGAPDIATISHDAHAECNRIMEDLFLSGADVDE